MITARDFIRPLLAGAVVCALIFSLGIHAVDTHHTHPGHKESHGHQSPSMTVIGEYTHATENKFSIAIISIWFLALATARRPDLLIKKVRYSFSERLAILRRRMYDPYQRQFSIGLLNPKLCE
jgi:hypothetical protein